MRALVASERREGAVMVVVEVVLRQREIEVALGLPQRLGGRAGAARPGCYGFALLRKGCCVLSQMSLG